jgi:hypothetical protein
MVPLCFLPLIPEKSLLFHDLFAQSHGFSPREFGWSGLLLIWKEDAFCNGHVDLFFVPIVFIGNGYAFLG